MSKINNQPSEKTANVFELFEKFSAAEIEAHKAFLESKIKMFFQQNKEKIDNILKGKKEANIFDKQKIILKQIVENEELPEGIDLHFLPTFSYDGVHVVRTNQKGRGIKGKTFIPYKREVQNYIHAKYGTINEEIEKTAEIFVNKIEKFENSLDFAFEITFERAGTFLQNLVIRASLIYSKKWETMREKTRTDRKVDLNYSLQNWAYHFGYRKHDLNSFKDKLTDFHEKNGIPEEIQKEILKFNQKVTAYQKKWKKMFNNGEDKNEILHEILNLIDQFPFKGIINKKKFIDIVYKSLINQVNNKHAFPYDFSIFKKSKQALLNKKDILKIYFGEPTTENKPKEKKQNIKDAKTNKPILENYYTQHFLNPLILNDEDKEKTQEITHIMLGNGQIFTKTKESEAIDPLTTSEIYQNTFRPKSIDEFMQQIRLDTSKAVDLETNMLQFMAFMGLETQTKAWEKLQEELKAQNIHISDTHQEKKLNIGLFKEADTQTLKILFKTFPYLFGSKITNLDLKPKHAYQENNTIFNELDLNNHIKKKQNETLMRGTPEIMNFTIEDVFLLRQYPQYYSKIFIQKAYANLFLNLSEENKTEFKDIFGDKTIRQLIIQFEDGKKTKTENEILKMLFITKGTLYSANNLDQATEVNVKCKEFFNNFFGKHKKSQLKLN